MMRAGEAHSNGLSKNRFRKLLLTWRFGGISLNMQSVPIIQSVYNVFIAVCFYSTFFSAVMEFLNNTDNLIQFMKSSRVVFGQGVVLWEHLFLR